MRGEEERSSLAWPLGLEQVHAMNSVRVPYFSTTQMFR